MEWIQDIFINSTFIQAIIVLSIICAIGLALGQIKIGGVSLGVTFVFFTGILAGHFGFRINPDMLLFAQNFGLVLFIYSLGVQVGPGFFSSFKQGGVKLNLLATSVLVLGTAMALGLIPLTGIPLPDMMGLLSGAVTNTPMLGAGQQTLLQIQPDNISGSNNMALACAVGYPMGVIGVILALVVLKTIFSRKITTGRKDESTENAFVSEFLVSNPAIFGLSIKEVMKLTSAKFVISRDWKKGKVNIPTSETIIEEGDHLLVISNKNDVDAIRTIFGEKADKDWNKKDIDWNRIDRQLVSRHILVTKPNINGVKLVSLKLRNTFGINITRVNRAGIDLLASPSLRLQLGDKLTIVGETTAIDHVAEILGNEEKFQAYTLGELLPFAFTELGVAMLSSVLRSATAIEINRGIMRAFVAVRQMIAENSPLNRLSVLERNFAELKQDLEEIFADYNDINEDTRAQIEAINTSLAELQSNPKEKPRRPVGFIKPKE